MLALTLGLFLVAVSSFGCGASSTSTSGNSKAVESTVVSSAAGTTTTSFLPGTSAAADAVAKRVADSLVIVETSGTKIGSGKSVDLGVVYSADGLILISRSATLGGTTFTVTLSDGETVSAKLVGQDKSTGVALLRIKKSGLSPVKLASEKVEVREWIALVSNLGSSITSAPASIVDYQNPFPERSDHAWSDEAVHVKTSTWPDDVPVAFDKQGDVVGVITGTGTGESSQGGKPNKIDFGLMLPADKVAAAVAKLLSGP